MMRIAWAALGLAIALLTPASAQAACSIEQRIELAKAGYDKDEVEQLCAEAAAAPAPLAPAAPQPRSNADILNSATYKAYDPARDPTSARNYIAPEQRCEFHDGFVRMNGFKHTSSGFESKDLPDRSLSLSLIKFKEMPGKGSYYAYVQIQGGGLLGNGGRCWALYGFNEKLDAATYASEVADLRQEYDAVLRALAARGID